MRQPECIQNKSISELSVEEWESLCCHCGVCCLNKIIDIETGDIYTTSVVCEFYDLDTGKCSVYDCRFDVNQGCTKLTPENILELSWLPNTCNYRRAYEKRPLLKIPKADEPATRKLEDFLGCEVIAYHEDLDLTEYVVFCQYG